MIKCIFTNIKNEHRYLEEWINYHIRLGFNKFILYEDEGSLSHESIIDKYYGIVDIDFYDYILEKDSLEFKDITCLKHVINNYTGIDWLIKLDPDEYIVLPEGETIDDLLYKVPKKINQITLFWKLYNANGFIQEPYHGKYNLMDTYIDPIETKQLATYFNSNVSINNYDIGKSLVRYKKYIKLIDTVGFADNFPHWFYPSSPEETLYPPGCINHYITKSFEEFYNRLKEKGEYNKTYYRKLGDFFVLNPDLIEKIPLIEEKFDVNIFTFQTKVN